MAVYEGILETCIRITEGGDTRITEAGDIRLLEYDGETVFSVDSITSTWAAQAAIDESVGVSDFSPVLWDAQVAIDESIGVYDNVLVEVFVAIDESVGVSDSSPVLWDAQGFLAELVSIDDSVPTTWNAQVELSESVSLSDTYVLARVYGKILNELISASDVLSVDWNAQGATDEFISASDVLSVDWNAQVELSESVFIEDSVPVAWNIQGVLTESIAAGDNILVEISVAIDESVLVSDAISVSGYIIGCWLTIEGNDTFQVGDILYMKEGLDAEWLEVTDVTFAPSYKVTRDKAGVYADGANPQWTKGASIVNYGQAGDGGIYLTASDTNAPHLSIFTHNGAPWNSITTHIREGNLNGYAGYETDIYGWASYIDANNYITIDPANGIRMSGEIVITGGSGITLLSDAGDLVTANDLDDIADGTNYGKILKTAISAGKIILTETIGNLDDIADGDSYGRVATTAISAGKIVLSSGTGVDGILPVSHTEADVTAEHPFVAYRIYEFRNSADDFSADNADITLNPDSIVITPTTDDPKFVRAVSIDGSLYDRVRVRIKRNSGSTWQGTLYYATSGHGFSASYYKQISFPDISNGEYTVLEWDMSDLTAGGDDWITNTITDIRFDFATSTDTVYEVDWVAIGKKSVGDITGENTAAAIADQGALATENAADWSTQVAGTNKPDDNADVTSAQFTNPLSDIDIGISRALNGLDASSMITKAVKASLLAGTPDYAGLWLTSGYFGYYDGASWPVYIKDNGDFWFGKDDDNYFAYTSGNLVFSTSQANGFRILNGGGMKVYDGGDITLTGTNARLIFDGGELVSNDSQNLQMIGWDSHVLISATGSEYELSLDAGSRIRMTTGQGTLTLGQGQCNISEYLWVDNDIALSGKIDLTTEGDIVADDAVRLKATASGGTIAHYAYNTAFLWTSTNFYADNTTETIDCGSSTRYWKTVYAKTYYESGGGYNDAWKNPKTGKIEQIDDLAIIMSMGTTGEYDEETGQLKLDHAKSHPILFGYHSEDGEEIDETGRTVKTWKKGDMITRANGKPAYNISTRIGVAHGAIRQLNAKIEKINQDVSKIKKILVDNGIAAVS